MFIRCNQGAYRFGANVSIRWYSLVCYPQNFKRQKKLLLPPVRFLAFEIQLEPQQQICYAAMPPFEKKLDINLS
jgi:hypothetical protein